MFHKKSKIRYSIFLLVFIFLISILPGCTSTKTSEINKNVQPKNNTSSIDASNQNGSSTNTNSANNSSSDINNYKTYNNERFGFSIIYPGEWSPVESDNGDGATLYKDDSIIVSAYAGYNVLGSFDDLVKQDTDCNIRKPFSMDGASSAAFLSKESKDVDIYHYIAERKDDKCPTDYSIYLKIDKTSGKYDKAKAEQIKDIFEKMKEGWKINKGI